MAVIGIPRRELHLQGLAPDFSVLLKRNCSISPQGLAKVFALIAGVTLGIAAAFAMAGAWLILPFAGLEVALVAAAFLAIGRHATDYERLDFAAGRLAVEVAAGGVTQRHLLEARAARVSLEARDGCQRLLLRAAGASLELGRHLDEAARRELAAELKDRLRIRIGKE